MANKIPALDRVLQALADPTRRAVLEQLRSGAVPIKDLAAPHAMALPSFTKHITILEKAGLIRTTKKGRSRICTLRPGQLRVVEDWLAAQRAPDDGRRDDLLAIARSLYPDPQTARPGQTG